MDGQTRLPKDRKRKLLYSTGNDKWQLSLFQKGLLSRLRDFVARSTDQAKTEDSIRRPHNFERTKEQLRTMSSVAGGI